MTKRKKFPQKHTLQTRSGTSIRSALPLGALRGIAIIVLAAIFVYLPSINGGFIWDDRDLISDNPHVKASDGLYRFWCTTEAADYWPVTNTSFWIEWRLWGTSTTGYHVTNLILHIVESLLIWIILRMLSIPGAFWAAVIFAVHPVNVESVAWIAQRKNMMAMLFFLLSILWYLKFLKLARRPTDHASHGARRCLPTAKQMPFTVHHLLSTFSSFILHPSSFQLWYWLSLVAFVLAMLSKGSVAILPLVLLGIIWWQRRSGTDSERSETPVTFCTPRSAEPRILKPESFHSAAPRPFFSVIMRDLLSIAPFFGVAVVLAGVNVWFQTHGTDVVIRNAGFTERLLGAGCVAWFYLYKALLPLNLIFVYPQWNIQVGDPLCWLPLMAVLALTAVLWRYREKWSRPFLFAWGFFCVALLPVMGLTDVYFMKYALVADHYQHIAVIGIITLATAGFSLWHRRTRGAMYWAAASIGIMAAGTLAFLTWQQSGLYRDEIILYQDTLEKNPSCWMAHNNLGLALYNSGRLQEAIDHYRQSLQVKLDNAEALNNLGSALAKMGSPQEAIDHCRQALRLKPQFPQAHNNLGLALAKIGRPREAIEHFQQALRLKPKFPEAHNNLGFVLSQIGQPRDAIEHYEKALSLKPDYPEAHYNLSVALVQTGQPRQAIEHYQQVLSLKPDSSEAHFNLAVLLVQAGRHQEAIKHYEQALSLKPNLLEAHNNLGVALARTGQSREAIEHFKQAIRLQPDYIDVHKNLALAHASMRQSSEAMAAALKAVELARSQGQTAQAKQIEDWLNSYRAGLSGIPNTPPPSQSTPPPP